MADKRYDYSEYERSEYEKYMAQWKGYRDVSLGYFNNDVYYRPDEKWFMVYVDDSNEDPHMDKVYEEMEGPMSEEEKKRERENDPIDPEEQRKKILGVLHRYQGVFDIHMDEGAPEPDYTESRLNYFSGLKITIPLGEGILNFCYADFSKELESAKPLYYLISGELTEELFEENPRPGDKLQHSERQPELIHNRTEEIIRVFEQYTNTISVLSDVFYCSLYTAIFPPVFIRQTTKALAYYMNYIKLLQNEFLELIEFCFDENFYPEVLGRFHPFERFSIYCHIKKRSTFSRRTEVFATRFRMSGDKLPYGLTADELLQRMKEAGPLTDGQKAFSKKFGLDPDYLEHRYGLPLFVNTSYECNTVRDMLYLEFTKILEQNIRFKKCKRCGRYFIMKGNYPGEYCDRVPEGETRTCQQLAAQENYQAKLKDNGAWGAYSKYYKRYFARSKVGAIKPPAFKQWQYAAVAKRDECAEGRLPLEEYIAWLEGSFPNREKKK